MEAFRAKADKIAEVHGIAPQIIDVSVRGRSVISAPSTV